MILDAGKKQYKIVREVFCGEKNDIVVCEELHSSIVSYQTVWRMKDREIAKFLLREFEREENNVVYEECFMIEENMYFSFPYDQERPLRRFYMSVVAGAGCVPEKIWKELVAKCMSTGLPDALMYLVFEQEQIQLTADGSVWFHYFLDLSKLDVFIQTKDCVKACAELICTLIRDTPGRDDLSAQLLDRRLKRGEYTDYLRLYQDIGLIADRQEKQRLSEKIRKLTEMKTDLICKVGFVICMILLATATSMLLSQLLFGDILFFRLFMRSFEQIGTESLLQ